MTAYFRRLSNSWIGKGLMAVFFLLILASFALVDVQSYISGGRGSPGALATAGKAEVTERELSSAMQRRLAEVRQQNPAADYASLSGEFGRILETLIQGQALQAFAADNELYLSKRMVDAEIVKIPGTRGLDGKFSQAAYQAFLQLQRMSDAEVRSALATGLTQRLLLAPAAVNARIPVGVATPYASMLLEEREAQVAIVPVELFANGIPAPSDADIQGFYKQNAPRYMVPEQRILSIAQIGPDQVAKVAASDQEIEAYYKANQAAYGGKETRVLTQAIVQSEADAKARAQQARASGNLGAGSSSLGAKSREELAGIAGDAVAAAAFAAKQGQIVGPIRSDLGWHVIKVDAIRADAGKSLASVRSAIADKLTADKRKEALTDIVTKVEDSIADGASLREAAQAAGLTILRTPAITAGGVARSQQGFKLPADLSPAVRAGFDLGPDDEPVVETLANDAGYALVGADEIIGAAPAPLASIRDQVAADWKTKQARDRARATANAIASKVSRGAGMTAAVGEAGVRLPAPETVRKRRIEISAAGGQVPPALAMMFSMAEGRSRMIAAPNGSGFVIVKVTNIKPGNASLQPGLISRMQSEFREAAGAEYAQQMTRAIEADVGVDRNEEAIAAAKRRITGSGG